MVGSSLSSGSLYNKVLIDVVGRFISGSGCFRRIFVPCHRSQYAFCQLTITLVRLQKKHYIDLITATCFFHGLLMIEQTVHHATISKAFQKMRSAFWPATKLKSKGIQNMKENYRKHTSYSSVFQSVVGHSAVFKWVIDLVQKILAYSYLNSRHIITTAQGRPRFCSPARLFLYCIHMNSLLQNNACLFMHMKAWHMSVWSNYFWPTGHFTKM